MVDMTKAAAALLICVGLVPSYGQGQPTFSGTWILDEKRSGSATHEAFVGPVVWVVEHSPDAVVLERRRGDKAASFTYPIAAKAPAPGAQPVAPGAEAPGNRGYWDGQRLVLETQQDVQGKTVTTRETLTLTEGGELIAERVLEVEHGYTLKGAQNFSAVKDFFVKRTP
jgi:hypothetical protein